MDLPAPAWRVKTRPCPFYQQGRCLFEDSCNFLHNVSVKSTVTGVLPYSQSPQTPQKPPLVTIHSPDSARSPSRSPRLTGLLDALKDVIGEEPDEEYNSEEATYVEEPLKGGNTCTVIDTSRSLPTESSGSSNYEEDDILRLEPQSTIQTAGTSPSPPSTSHLISPVDLHLGSFSPDDPVDTLVSPLKSTFGVLSSPFATASSRVLSPRLSAFISRSHSSSYTPPPAVEDDNNVHFDMSLDSPSDHAFNQPQPEPSEEYIVTEELDRSPLFPCAPPPAVRDDGGVPSDASLEAPFDHALDTVELEPSEEYPVAEEPAVEGNTLEHDKDSEGDGNVEASSVVARECDVESTSVHVGMSPLTPHEVRDALRQASMTPIHFLTDTAEFDENEAIANSSMHHPFLSSRLNCGEVTAVSPHDLSAPDATYGLGSDPPVDSLSDTSRLAPEDHAESDNTAELAYLHSPTVEVNENDTIHSLIEQYCSDAESSSNSTESPLVKDNESPVMESPLVTPLDDILLDTAEIESPSGTTPVRSTFIRERVFTPPPIMSVARGRSGTVTASDSPRSNSPPPPIPFSRPPFQPSPGSAWSPDSAVFEVQEAVVSKKVAFGFRKPLGQSNASHMLSRRNSLAVRPPPPGPAAHVASVAHTENTSPTSAPAAGLRPLRLSSTLASQPSSAPARKYVFSVNSYRSSKNLHRASISSTSVLSDYSYSHNPLLLSSNRTSVIPEHVRNTQFTTDDIPSPLSSIHIRRLTTFSTLDYDSPRSAPLSRPSSWQSNPPADMTELSEFTQNDLGFHRPFSRVSETSFIYEDDEEEEGNTIQEDQDDHVIHRALPIVPHSAPVDHRASAIPPPIFSVVTPKPTLIFAIASDDVKQVRQVLESGDASPNDAVGPQSALAFALTNDQLTHKMEIVKTLLAFGADPKMVIQSASTSDSSYGVQSMEVTEPSSHPTLMDALDPATRYYVERADAPHTRRTSALIHRSFFRPLTRVRYELIGQDRALEQLFKDLSMHSRQLSVTPIVVLLCGPSGHGKSLLARKFGALLDVPTHTVDMTTIHSAQDLWKSYSMSPDDPPSTRTLAEFLCDNEGKRCVVVLDEIEKTHGESPLWALLMPWEHGRCTFEAHGRLVDVRNVVWLGTSNIGQDLVFEHHNARVQPNELMSKTEYTELMALLRPRVSERLGTSMLSRVTTVLPFVPFTPEERRAICYEALHTIAGDIIPMLSTDVVDSMVKGALADYTAAEGARSLYRAVSNQLVDNI